MTDDGRDPDGLAPARWVIAGAVLWGVVVVALIIWIALR